MTVPVHPPSIDLEYDRLASPGPHLACRLQILREMDVVPLAPDQPLFQDRRQEPLDHPMIEEFGRLPLLQLQVHLDAVPLVGTDQATGFVEGEP